MIRPAIMAGNKEQTIKKQFPSILPGMAETPAESTNSDETDVRAHSEDCGVEAETPLAQEQCHETRKKSLREFTKAVKVAFHSYTRQDNAARDRGEFFDGPVYVDYDSQISPRFTAEELISLVCQSARGSKGILGTNAISAPDVAMRSVYSANGIPLRDTVLPKPRSSFVRLRTIIAHFQP
jgi:hypothetical protein